MTMHLESTNGVNGCRRFYQSDQANFTVEICECEYDRSPNSLMTLWVKHGWMRKYIEKTLSVTTYYTDDDGNCFGIYNPQVKTGINEYGNPYPEINFSWMLEATPKNEQRLLNECERLMLADKEA